MRLIADTNTIVSGLLWQGSPRTILSYARIGLITLFTSPPLLAELDNVLKRDKFLQRLNAAQVTPQELVTNYAALALVVQARHIEPVILDDPDDDAVLACAITAKADTIISGDRHLLQLGSYQQINICSASDFINDFK